VSQRLIEGSPTNEELSDQLLSPAWRPAGRLFQLGFWMTGAGTLMLLLLILYSVTQGVGVWGNNIPVAWGFPIINFVWWIGIGHAGTFISAVLLLLEQPWRQSINRFAEAMTIFAVIQAGLFPVLHLGRAWFAYWVFPYPSTMAVWPQFRSALPWDAAAISTYFTVSLLFWYVGLIPDLAGVRDRAKSRRKRRIYGFFALGWRGSARDWRRHRIGYGLLAGIATPLVISVHSIVSTDFATTMLPGWHTTIFPPYFVAGAIFSGFAMVITVLIPARRMFKMHNVITDRHIDALAKLTLVTGLIVTYSYGIEYFIAWYSGDEVERYTALVARTVGPGAWVWWLTFFCNCVVIQLLWSRRLRTNLWLLWIVSVLVNVGMWGERFFLIVLSLQRDFLPSAWEVFLPTLVDWGILFGTMFFFMFLFLAFMRFVPFVPVAETKELLQEHLDEEAVHE
jgi:Ni/Fe-hydrogenase subunit HybB-like protein